MAKKEKVNVKIITAPNGYALDIGGHGFFYFTLQDLLEGFIYHVGFKEMGEVSQDKIGDIVEAAVTYKDNAKLVKQITSLEHDKETLKFTISSMEQEIESKKTYAKSLRERLAEKSERVKELEEVLKEHPNWLSKIEIVYYP